MDFKDFKNIYFVGIGGIGMSALARYFKSINKKVLGYDRTKTKITQALEDIGIAIVYQDEIRESFSMMSPEDTLVVYTPAIKKLKILDYFEEKGFAILKRAKVLGLITEKTQCLAVAGTHGKTTTSTLLAHLCKVAKMPFSCFLGGISENLKSNFYFSGDKFSIVEADEYDRSFLNLSPDWAIITSTDADHLDIYGSTDAIKQSFKDFSHLVQRKEHLFIRKGIEIESEANTYAVNEEADFYSDKLEFEDGKINFTFYDNLGNTVPFSWEIPGIHNVENATAAIALLRSLGVEYEVLQEGIASFKGIKRRYTKHVFSDGRVYVDDYAHHPTELNAVIDSVRAFSPDKKLLVVFQPHLFSRTRDFATDFAKSLSKPDELILLDIYPAREHQEDFEGITSEWLLEKVNLQNKEVSTLSEALEKIKEKDFDILLTVGAGDIDTLYDKIIAWFDEGKSLNNKK